MKIRSTFLGEKMAEKREIDVLEVMRHLEIETKKVYQFLSRLQESSFKETDRVQISAAKGEEAQLKQQAEKNRE
jgi:hypothetical protein